MVYSLMDLEDRNREICHFVVFHKSTKEENTKENSKIKINARVQFESTTFSIIIGRRVNPLTLLLPALNAKKYFIKIKS